jgi:glycosyltransferase involved in cell wall biosynthesis
MNIAIVTDAWIPQTNGVVTTYHNTAKQLAGMGSTCYIIGPDQPYFKKIPLPGYSEIKIVINPWRIRRVLQRLISNKVKIHVATEGPLGLYTRLYLATRGYSFTTCYHTKFPEFVQERIGFGASLLYPYFRWFHSASKCVMVPTEDMKTFLHNKGFNNLAIWTRGVDTILFAPTLENKPDDYILCVSRVSHEKNIDAFCSLKYPRKLVVGDGPYLSELKSKYPDVEFLGKLTGKALVDVYNKAKCFVFPSREDTFGIVMLEAIACGTPVASYPCPGANAVVTTTNGIISTDLDEAVEQAITLDRWGVRDSSARWSWEHATFQFLSNIEGDILK